MESGTLHGALAVDLEAGVLTLALDRPERRNAIDPAMRDALARALDQAAADPEVRAVILTGAGGAFCAGGDVKAMAEFDTNKQYLMTIESGTHVLAQTKFWLRGKGPKYTGKVEFSDEEAKQK